MANKLGPELSAALPTFHAFTGSDYTSAFVRRGTVRPFKLLQQHPHFVSTFQHLGDSACLDDTTFNKLQHFVCCMYSQPTLKETNKARYHIFSARYEQKFSSSTFTIPDGVDFSLLPPCKASLYMHALLSNFVALVKLVWRNAHIARPMIPTPFESGWMAGTDGSITNQWTSGDILPQNIVDIMYSASSTATHEVLEEVEENCEIDNMIDEIFEDECDDI